MSGATAVIPAATTPAVKATQYEQSWADFLLGRVNSFTQAKTDITPDMRQQQIEIYGQDEYRLKPNLTVTLGVRYSHFGMPTDNNHYLSSFDPALWDPAKAPAMTSGGSLCLTGTCINGTLPNPNYDPLNGIIIAGQTSPYGNAVSNTPGKNFAPRAGIAWDPWKDGKTSIRAGYGLFNDSVLVGMYENNIFINPPFVPNVTASNIVLGNVSSAATAASVLNLKGTPVDMHIPYSQQWSLDIQRQLTKTLTVDVGYVGNNAQHLLGAIDINSLAPGVAKANGINPDTIVSTSTTAKLNPYRPYVGYGYITAIQSRFFADYHSLQVSVKKTFKGNSLINAYYTWSKALTNNQSDRANAPQNAYDINAEYGLAAIDRRHVFTANFVYELPWFKQQKGIIGKVAGGWQVSGIASYYTGLPVNARTSNLDPGGLGLIPAPYTVGRPDMVADPNTNAPHTFDQYFNTYAFVTVPPGSDRPGNAPINAIIGPGLQRWNTTLARKFLLRGESTYLQFRAEYYNVFNHTNFSGLQSNISQAGFGNVTSVRDPRIGQLALKLYF